MLEAGKHGFGVIFVGAVDLGIREGESDGVHRSEHSSHGWVVWRCWSGSTVMVMATAVANWDAEANMLMGTYGRESVMNLGQVLNFTDC